MATTLGFKEIIDLPTWRSLTPSPNASAAGSCWAWDARNSERNAPYNYLLVNATTFLAYDPHNDEFLALGSPTLTGTFGAGAAAIMHPTQGPRGTLTTGNTTTSVVLSTALPAAVAINQLANRGDGVGFTIRIIGSASGSSGKTEERTIVANTAGTTPTITVDSAFSFTPASGDAYEIRSGRVFLLSAGSLAAGMWKFYDLATNSFSGNLATANLPATVGADSSLVALSEGHVPSDAADTSSGFFGVITASASSGTTITSTGLPSTLQTNEYRNFQVRIVEDTSAPTAVGQRRRISSHTSGATAVWTVAAWAVTPSATAKFVIENDDDKIILFTNQNNTYNYNITANTWDTSTWAVPGTAGAAGIVAAHSYGIVRDTTNNARHSFIYRVRGGNVNTIDVLDIAGAATGSWSADIAYGNKATAFNTGTSGAADPITQGGKYLYLNISGTQRFARFDMRNRVLEPWTYLPYTQGTALVGGKMSMCWFLDGSTKLGFLQAQLNTGTNLFSIACQR